MFKPYDFVRDNFSSSEKTMIFGLQIVAATLFVWSARIGNIMGALLMLCVALICTHSLPFFRSFKLLKKAAIASCALFLATVAIDGFMAGSYAAVVVDLFMFTASFYVALWIPYIAMKRVVNDKFAQDGELRIEFAAAFEEYFEKTKPAPEIPDRILNKLRY